MRKKLVNLICLLVFITGLLSLFNVFRQLWWILDLLPDELYLYPAYTLLSWPFLPLFLIIFILNNYPKPIPKTISIIVIILGIVSAAFLLPWLFHMESGTAPIPLK